MIQIGLSPTGWANTCDVILNQKMLQARNIIIILLLKKVPDSIKVSFNVQIALPQFISQELVKQVTYILFISEINPDSTIVVPVPTGSGTIGSREIGGALGFSEIIETGTQDPVIPVAVVPVWVFDIGTTGRGRAGISHWHSATSTSFQSSTQNLPADVSTRRELYFSQLIRSLLASWSLVQILYDPSRASVSQNTRPSLSINDAVVADTIIPYDTNKHIAKILQNNILFI